MNSTNTPSAPVTLVLSRLNNVKPGPDGWMAHCPAHADKKQSLSISEGRAGRCVINCFANCDPETIVRALGLSMGDLFVKHEQPDARRIAATYDYVDPSGALLYQSVRYLPKDFRQRTPDGRGGWEWKLNGIQRVPYRLPELLKAVESGQTIYIVEGEKDVDTLRALGLVATCNPEGAGKWQPYFRDYFPGASVVILSDNDAPGRKHSQQVATNLSGTAQRIKIIDLPGLAEKGDVSDWLALGHTPEDLQQLVIAAPAWTPASTCDEPAAQHESSRTWLTEDELDNLPPPTWLVDQEIAATGMTVLYGPSGAGKTFVAIDYAMRIAGSQGPVMYLAAEDVQGVALRKRAWREFHQVTDGTFYTWPEEVNLLNPAAVDAFIDQVQALGLKTFIVDTLHQCLIGGSDSDDKAMGTLVYACKRIQRATGAAPILLHHTGKNGSGERGSSALRAAAYTMLELTNEDGLIRLTCDKAKNSTPFADRYLRLFETGGSCVVVPAESVLPNYNAPLSSAQRKILEVLDYAIFEHVGAKASELERATNLPHNTMFRTLSHLKRRGYIEQSVKGDPYYLTAMGRAALAKPESSTTPPSPPVPPVEPVTPPDSTTAVSHQKAVVPPVPPQYHAVPGTTPDATSTKYHPVPPPFKGGTGGTGTSDGQRRERQEKGDVGHDHRREDEALAHLVAGRFKEARKAANLIRGYKDRERVLETIDADDEAARALQTSGGAA